MQAIVSSNVTLLNSIISKIDAGLGLPNCKTVRYAELIQSQVNESEWVLPILPTHSIITGQTVDVAIFLDPSEIALIQTIDPSIFQPDYPI